MKRTKFLLVASVIVIMVCIQADMSFAKIPEPDNIIFGTVRINEFLFPSDYAFGIETDTITVTLSINSNPNLIASYTMGAVPGAGDFFILDVPIDAIDPQELGTARPGDEATIYINGEEVKTIHISERGDIQRIDLAGDFIDTDGDGLADIVEESLGTDINDPDTDKDTLSDGEEVMTYKTNPSDEDTDDDGLPDDWEVQHNLNPQSEEDAMADADGDNSSNMEEYQSGCDPQDASSYPGAQELCDAKDNDCDGRIDEEGAKGCTTYYRDEDMDGYGVDGDTGCTCAFEEPYTASLGGDCDDNDPNIYPRLVRLISSEGYPGETYVVVPVTIDDAIDVTVRDIFLTYDPNILTARNIIIAPLIQDFLTDSYIIEAEGKVVLEMADSAGFELESGTLAEIVFDVSEVAVIGNVVPLVFERLSIYDDSGETYCGLPINGEFRIVERCHKGDLCQDEEITAADAILALKISVGTLTPSDYQKCAGDLNGDDDINAADAILILNAAVKKETIFLLKSDHGLPAATTKIIGWNFGETQGDSVLYFGDMPVDPISWMNHEIVATVPSNIQTGTVDVTLINAAGFSSNSRVFIVSQENQRLRNLDLRFRTGEDSKTVRIPTGIIAAPCDQVNIPVETDDAAGIAGMDLELHFDPAILMPVQVERTSLTDGFLLMFKASGDGLLRISLANDRGIIKGSEALINVIFEVIPTAQESDSTRIILKNVQFYDENADPIEGMAHQDGQVLIDGESLCKSGKIPGMPFYPSLIWPSPYYPYAGHFTQPGSWTILRTYPLGNGYYYPNHSSQQFLKQTFSWQQSRYDYYHLSTSNYQAIYPDFSFFILW